ncbi:MAG: F0F1 ATP synthase subunit alpha [Alphaproteobacteria bacterium]
MCYFALNPDLAGGIKVRFGSVILDDSLLGKWQSVRRQAQQENLNEIPVKKIPAHLLKKMSDWPDRALLTEVGRVESLQDSVAHIVGLPSVQSGEKIVFESGATGMVMNLNEDSVDVCLIEGGNKVQEEEAAYRTNAVLTIPTGLSVLGRVLDPLGKPLDGKALVSTNEKPLMQPAPDIIARHPVAYPVHTGITAVDALIPIGRGQRELIIGDRQTGKTSLILDTILAQRERNNKGKSLSEKLFCIYVAIGQKHSSVRHLMQELKKNDALDYTCIISASASDSACLRYLAPYAGSTIAEYFRDNGMHAIVFYDDLSKHAVAYREMSLLLKRPAGREAYPGDVFYLHSRLLERAAQLNQEKGSGSLTAIPVIETQEGDLSAYIPTNVISITDGQIYLDNDLFNQNIKPAINVGLSVSRIGSSAQSAFMKRVSGHLKLELAQYREVLSFSQLASDLDPATHQLLERGARLTELLKQKNNHPLSLAEEALPLFAGVQGHLDQLPVDKVSSFATHLRQKALALHPEWGHHLNTQGDLSSEETTALEKLIQEEIPLFKGEN